MSNSFEYCAEDIACYYFTKQFKMYVPLNVK